MHPDGYAHGGSAILIKKSIKHYESTHYRTEEIQATNVIVQDSIGALLISAIYSPLKHKIKNKEYVKFFKTLGARFIAGGDYNAKNTLWGSRLTTTKGRELHNATTSMNLKVFSTGEPTYWPSDPKKIPDLVDFCVIKGLSYLQITCRSCLDLSSDHSPVIITINDKLENRSQNCQLINSRTNWTQFKTILTSTLGIKVALKNEEDIIEATEYLTKCIQDAAWSSTTHVSPHTRTQRNSNIGIFLRNKLKEKRQARKIWQQTRSPEYKSRFNKLSKEIKLLLKEQHDKEMRQFLWGLEPTHLTNYSLWKVSKKVSTTKEYRPPLRKKDGSWAKTAIEKSELFSKYLKDIFIPNDTEADPCFDSTVAAFLNEPYQMELPMKKFTKSEIVSTIKKLKDHKAPGYDRITAEILKKLPPEPYNFITHLFNACLTRNIFPAQWKVAEIKMVLKTGKPGDEVKSYRPISLLPILSKVFEKIFLKRLMVFIERKQIIPKHQFGFRNEHSTIEQVHRLVEKIQTALDRKQICSAVFLDISQAFDRVWHQGLLFKIKKKLPLNAYLLLKSYLNQRMFYVNYENEISNFQQIKAGVPQGSILGPILYLIFTHDLPTTKGVLTGTFADDTAIMATAVDPVEASYMLQISINKISKWLRNWRLKVNEHKSQHVTFTTKRTTCSQINLNSIPIPQCDSAKYLGIHLDKRLTWKTHIFAKRKALGLIFRNMYWLLNRKSTLSMDNKLILYKSLIKPVWTYGIQLWGTASNSNLEILQRFQSKTLRTLVNAPWYVTNAQIHRDLDIPSIKEEIQNVTSKYRNRLQSHPNELASTLMSPSCVFLRLKRKTPIQLVQEPSIKY